MFTKPQEQENGFSAEYWDLHEIVLSSNPKLCVAKVRLYKNKNAKQNGKSNIKDISFSLEKDAFPLTNDQFKSIKQAVRQAIKEHIEFFSDAEEEAE